MLRRLLTYAVIFPPLLHSTLAHADSPDTEQHLRGAELMLRPAFGGAASNSPVRYEASPNVRIPGGAGALLEGASPYGAGFIGQVSLGYRFHPLLSGGLRAGMRSASASALSDGSTSLSRSAWDAGFYLRAYPLALSVAVRKHLDPWVSVGVAYVHDSQSFQRPAPTTTGTVNADWILDHHAVAVPLGIGVDYRLHPVFSIGPSFEYTVASAVAGCVEVAATGYSSNKYCSNEDPGKQVIKAKTYGVWSLGVDLKLTFL